MLLTVGCADHSVDVDWVGQAFEALGLRLHLHRAQIHLEYVPAIAASTGLLHRRIHWHLLVEIDVILRQLLADSCQAVLVERVVLFEFIVLPVRWGRDRRWRYSNVLGAVCVLLQAGLVLPHVHCSAESSIEGSSIQDDSILDVVSRVTHDCDRGILPCRQLFKVADFQCL